MGARMDEPKHNQVLFALGRYQALKLIGKGGMGEVFLAYDTHEKNTVALKRLCTDQEISKEDQDQFLREAYTTKQFCHPSIIPIYSVVIEKNAIYYTMPFIEGITLKELLIETQEKQGIRGSIPSICQIFLQICQAIAYAHSKGFIHRDLKPSNIMIGKYGEVVISDWGLITAVSQELNKENKVSGTMAYMAPELIYGEPPSCSAEVYSLG